MLSDAELDTRLFGLLREDGRAGYTHLGQLIGVPRARVADRVRALLASADLQIVTSVDPAILGVRTIAHLSLTLDVAVLPFLDALRPAPEVVLASAVAGRFDAVVEVRVPTPEHLAETLRRIRAKPGVRTVEALMYLGASRGYRHVRPAGPPPVVDDLDLALIELLRRDGRRSYRELAEEVGRSAGAVRTRVRALLDRGAIRIEAITGTADSSGRLAGVGLRLGDADPEEVVDRLALLPGTHFAVPTLGRFDVVATIRGDSARLLQARLDELRCTTGVRAIESWIHLDVRKERYEWPVEP
ncbi:Lrp/AsnC family transcriptional regulator [Embleya hyalina]|uniref:AsnC family transcriptional regulator n=1 Tax=Embleya hyalina TaxID=516124 RepID=A0A401YEQ5_9ACTN|nr:Lrp/AsnC family transcriptional regulator [Embleya hyalina]GCD93083.1 AsnC family transcriptional regulator [Embleya hyalina]